MHVKPFNCQHKPALDKTYLEYVLDVLRIKVVRQVAESRKVNIYAAPSLSSNLDLRNTYCFCGSPI